MLHIKKIEDGIDLYKALGSDLRIQIIKLLLEKGEMNMNEIAGSLGITNGALTSHIKKLEECGLVSVLSEHEGHGNQKLCRVHTDRILIDVYASDSGRKQKSLLCGYSRGPVHRLSGVSHLRHRFPEKPHRRSGRPQIFCPSPADPCGNPLVLQGICRISHSQLSPASL